MNSRRRMTLLSWSQDRAKSRRKDTKGFTALQGIRARSTRLAGSVRDYAIDLNLSTSASPSHNSIARRHAAIAFSPSSSMPRTHRSLKRQMNPSLMTTFNFHGNDSIEPKYHFDTVSR
jgi:hypothetical protein